MWVRAVWWSNFAFWPFIGLDVAYAWWRSVPLDGWITFAAAFACFNVSVSLMGRL